MKEGWKKVKIGDIAFIEMGQSPKSEYYNSSKEGLPFLQGNRTFGERFPYFDTYCTFNKKIAEKGSILMSVRAPVGDLNIAPEKISIGRGLCSLNAKNKNNFFLFYLLKYFKKSFLNKETGTIFGSINKNDILSLEVNYPICEKIQTKISNILLSLDEKIELNRKLNQNLEEIAQTLFKRWFIDFEFPNEEGKPYKSSGGKMIESELGEIPKGWRVGKLGEIVEINPRENLKKLEKKIYIEMKCLSEVSSIISEYYEREFTGTGTKFKNKDTLMARITPCLENGKIGYVNFLKDNDIGWGSTEFNILRSQNNIPRELSYFIARSKKFLDYAISNMNGSSGRQRVSGKILEEYNIVISSENIYKKFGKVSNTIMNQIENNRKEIEKLIELRDYLLSKLMNGEIDVSNLKISEISNSD